MVKSTDRSRRPTIGEKIVLDWGARRNIRANWDLLDYIEKFRPKGGYESPRGIEWGELAQAIDRALKLERKKCQVNQSLRH